MKVLVSVRDPHEALQAARAGVHFIDLKEPANGALGALRVELIQAIVPLLRSEVPGVRISATVGDLPAEALQQIARQVHAVAACGVDYVKVGVPPGPAASALLDHLATLQRGGVALVPVILADDEVPQALVRQAAAGGFPALMFDTQHKARGSLLERQSPQALASFISTVRSAGAMAGLSGALRLRNASALRQLAPDFAGFRSAVCADGRAGALDGQRLQAVLDHYSSRRKADDRSSTPANA
jgi:uncharacterized protein (UPF0264 family)